MSEELTRKQDGFVADYIDTGNATEAAARNYDVENRATAAQIGYENLKKPDIRKKIEEACEGAFSMIVALSTGAENETVRLNASKDILDRGGLKPVERTDITSGDKPLPILHVLNNNSDQENSIAE